MLTIDLSDFERRAKELRANLDQLPYALSNAMTSAAFRTREALISETWAGSVEVRDRNFIRNALQIEKATKGNLKVAIYDALGRGHLSLHAHGGTKRAKRRLAIPPAGSVRRTSRGVVASQTPRAIIARTPKRALRITSKGIFVGEGGKLRLKYVFAGSAQIDKDVPFVEDFQRMMADEIRAVFPTAIKNAMKTRGKVSTYDRQKALGRRRVYSGGERAHGNAGPRRR